MASKSPMKPATSRTIKTHSTKRGSGRSNYYIALLVVIVSVAAYFTGFLDYGIENYEQFHHDRVKNFYGSILVDYHEYHRGYLTFGLWKNLTTGERIDKFEDAAENLYEELARRANLTKESDLLDVACGMASQDIYLYNKFGANITALDLLDKHIKIAQQKMKKVGLEDKIRLVNASATAMPFDDETFTHVLCAEGGPHMHTREAFFKEAMRVLKPGGAFAFSDTTVALSSAESGNIFAKIAYRIVGYLWRCSLDNIVTNDQYVKQLEEIGFTNVKLIGVNLDVYPDYQRSSWEGREELYVVRGKFVTWAGALIDVFLRQLSEWEYIDYVLVTGQKPAKL